MTFLAEHKLLFQVLTVVFVVGLALSVVWVALPGRARGGKHRSPLTAADRQYTARHAARSKAYLPHHAAVDGGLAVALGHTPDGDLALMDDTHELIGASA